MDEKKYRVLVVDDETDLCDILKFNLEAEGYYVTTTNSAEEALEKNVARYDLLLLDVMMGGMDGFTLARMLKKRAETSQIPIIFLTARTTESDTVNGLDIGADDYIAKPFSIREVKARIKAVLRRTHEQAPDQQVLTFKSLQLNLDKKTVSIDDEEIPFSKTEFEILALLLREKGHVFSRQELINRIWPRDVMVLDRTVDVNITRVRKKIKDYARHIITRLGYGYFFEE
ncbi:MAG: response regulator transcription factor [Prevotella sp.]|nr:response regulator transcription factor [Prevotella sp.]MDD7606619.1 response regulator transcription factor [Prevotellaceae bacterium]MDY3247982.1 response regulator transcription factor [Prevotella sp.]